MNPILSSLSPEDILLKNALINQYFVQPDAMEKLLQERDSKIDHAKKLIKGNCYLIDYDEKKLKVFDTYSGDQIAILDLPSKPSDLKPDEFDAWGNSILIIDLEEMQKEGEILYYKDNNYGLVVCDDKSYFYAPDLEKQSLLAISKQYIYGGIPKNKNTYLPYDMYLSPDNKMICLANRDEGNIYIFDINTNTFTDKINVRRAGSGTTKSINVAISNINKKIFITDGTTTEITIYNLESKETEKKYLDTGLLGNICLSPDQKSIYIVTTKPEVNLKSYKTINFEEIMSFFPKGDLFSISRPAKGDLFSIGNDPCDLLTLSPDNKYLLLMTYLDDPMYCKTVINVIDIEKNKTIKRFSLKDRTKPINISFKEINPMYTANKSFEAFLIEKELFTLEKLNEIKESMHEHQLGFIDVEKGDFEFEMRQDEQVEEGIPEPKKLKHIIISKNVNKFIIEILLGNFWQKSEIDLTNHPEQLERIKEVADNIRKKLEFYDLEIIEIPHFFEEQTLEAVVQRLYILEMLNEEESNNRQTVKSSPDKCLNCGSPMFGSWECPACGLVYEKSEDTLRKKEASFDHLANLNKGNFFILDSENGLLVEVNNYKTPVWQVKKEDLELKSITEAIRLENHNTLIVDRDGAQIVEVTPKGSIAWKYEAKDRHSVLDHPSGVAVLNSNNFLIADTNHHHVIEIDFDGKIIWQYGSQYPGMEYNTLNKPTSIQKTYDNTYLINDSYNNRIIELSKHIDINTGLEIITIVWECHIIHGENISKHKLSHPVMAFKDLNGNVLILDQGNKRVLEINQECEVIWEYNTENVKSEYNISNPTRISRLKNKDLLIVGDNKAIQVFVSGHETKIVWATEISLLSEKTISKISPDTIIKSKKTNFSKYKSKFSNSSKEIEFIEKEKINKKINADRYMIKSDDIEDLELSNLAQNKKVNASHYMNKSDESIDVDETDQTDLSKTKVNSNHYMKKSDESIYDLELKSVSEAKKMVNASHYMNKSDNENPEQLEIDEKEKKLNEIIEKRLSEENIEIDKPKAILTKGQTVMSIPILIIDKIENKITIANREASPIWSYGNSDDEKIKNISSVEITPQKTILVADSRSIFEIDISNNKKVWEYDCHAKSAVRLNNGNTLVTDEKNLKVFEVNKNNQIIWEYYNEKVVTHATRLSNGNTLLTYKSNTVEEIDHDYNIVWSFGEYNISSHDDQHLSSPEYASRLKNGNTMITDTRNARVIEVSNEGKIVWSFINAGVIKLILPNIATRLKNGNTYITHANYRQSLEVNYDGEVVWRLIMPKR